MIIPRLRGLRPGLSCRRAMSSYPPLHVNPPDPATESAEFDARVARIAQYFARPRFADISRPYSPRDVALKQGSAPVLPLPASLLADKLFRIFEHASAIGLPVHTMGAIDPVQMTQMASHQQVVYVSGWAASSLLTTGSNEVGPDFGYVPLLPPSLAHSYPPGTIHIPQFQTRYNVYSVPSNSTTKSITMSACPLPQTHAQICHTSTTSVLSSQMLTPGTLLLLSPLRRNTHNLPVTVALLLS